MRKEEQKKNFARRRLNAILSGLHPQNGSHQGIAEDDPYSFSNDISPSKDDVDSYLSDCQYLSELSILERHPAFKDSSFSKIVRFHQVIQLDDCLASQILFLLLDVTGTMTNFLKF